MATTPRSSGPHRDPLRRITAALRWSARILALVALVFMSTFFLAHVFETLLGTPAVPTAAPTAGEWGGFALMAGLLAGLATGWWRPLLGGGVGLASMALFYLWMFVLRGRFPGGPTFPLLVVPALLFIVVGWLERRLDRAG